MKKIWESIQEFLGAIFPRLMELLFSWFVNWREKVALNGFAATRAGKVEETDLQTVVNDLLRSGLAQRVLPLMSYGPEKVQYPKTGAADERKKAELVIGFYGRAYLLDLVYRKLSAVIPLGEYEYVDGFVYQVIPNYTTLRDFKYKESSSDEHIFDVPPLETHIWYLDASEPMSQKNRELAIVAFAEVSKHGHVLRGTLKQLKAEAV